MKEKTLEDFKHEVMIQQGFKDIADAVLYCTSTIKSKAGIVFKMETLFDIAAERYANHLKEIALQEWFEKGCKEQKVECAKHANILISNSKWNGTLKQIGYIDRDGSHYDVDKESILHAPDAVSPFVTENKYPIGGFAPGNYTNTCVTCKEEFIGDKLARQCEPCAIKMTK